MSPFERRFFVVWLIAIILIIGYCASAVRADGPTKPAFWLHIQDSSGAPSPTPWMEAVIGSGDNVAYTTLPGSTAGYWYDEGTTNRWSVQYFASPWSFGDYQWIGHIETGTSDLRSQLVLDWLRDDFQNMKWFLFVYSVDTRHRLIYEEIAPGDPSYGSYTIPMSRGGYDVLLAATQIPEPSSLLMFGTGLIGLIGFGSRRRR